MPNHVQNKIVFSGDQKQITAMMKKYKTMSSVLAQ